MARIKTYTFDTEIGKQDKLIGTDSNQSTTRNYSFEDIGKYLNNFNVVSVVGQNNFKFQDGLSSQLNRESGSISFESYNGIGTAFSAVTELIFSHKNTAGLDSNTFISTLVGKDVMLSDLSNPNNFGVYKMTAFTELDAEPNFFKATLNYIRGNGAFVEGGYYGYAPYSSSAGSEGAVQTFDMESEDGSLFTVAVTNAGVLIVIPEGSTEPVITSPPVLTGTEKVWYTLGAIAGGVTGSPAPERTWQWQRSTNGLVWTDITGANGATYTLVAEDAGKYIRVQQTETNVLDSVTANSAATGLIADSVFSTTIYANITPITWENITQTWN